MIPESAKLDHSAILGKTGSGKTATGKLLIEDLARHKARICVLDPLKSDWWGITLMADGVTPAFPFTILGGPRKHLPLNPRAGAAVGRLVAEGALPLSILDMADFGPGDMGRFYLDFAESLFKHNHAPLYLVIEEAHEFAPKERSGVDAENMMVYWSKRLATAARSKGVRLVVLTQRVQALHNAVLGSCETIIAHRQTMPADQEPILKMVKGMRGEEAKKTVAKDIASLATGEAWVISHGVFERRQFPLNATYDNTKTPSGKSKVQVAVPDVDLSAIAAALKDSVEEVEDQDVKLLREKVKTLKEQLLQATAAPQVMQPADIEQQLQDARLGGFEQAASIYERHSTRLKELGKQMLELANAIGGQVGMLDSAAAAIRDNASSGGFGPATASHSTASRSTPRSSASSPEVASRTRGGRTNTPASTSGNLDQRILDGLSWWCAAGHVHVTRPMLAFRAGASPNSSHFTNRLGAMKSAGLIDYPGPGFVALTQAGAAKTGSPERRPTNQELQEQVRSMLGAGSLDTRIIDVLIAAYPAELSREAVARGAGASHTSSHYTNRLGALRSAGLIDYPSKSNLQAADWLCQVAAASKKRKAS